MPNLLARPLRAQMSAAAQEEAAACTLKHVTGLRAYKEANTVMAYIAARGELSLKFVIEDILSTGRRLVLPRCESPGVMTARVVDGLDQLEPGAYGLMEPARGCEIAPPQEIDLILVPGTAFDREGNRIGQGGGYYDRFLPETRAVRAGVCHNAARIEHIDAQPHDMQMDFVITPGGVYVHGRTQE